MPPKRSAPSTVTPMDSDDATVRTKNSTSTTHTKNSSPSLQPHPTDPSLKEYVVKPDDCTISTIGTSNLSSSSTVTHELTVKFSFQLPADCNQYAEAAKHHIACLGAIQQAFTDVTLQDNHGHKVNTLSSLGKESAYRRHFNLHFLPANEYKDRPSMIMSVHRLYTTATINQIRRHPLVVAVLHKTNGKLFEHLFPEDKIFTTKIGFYVGVDPSNCLKSQFENAWKRISIHSPLQPSFSSGQ
jgi:hypothetical protein